MLALALLVALADPPTENALPVLRAFDNFCLNLDSVEQIGYRALEGGWEKFVPDQETELSKLANAMSVMPSDAFQHQLSMFQSSDKRQKIIAMNVTAPDGSGSIECKAIDDTIQKPDERVLTNWTGSEPVERKVTEETEVLVWAPAHLPSLKFVAAYYIPLDSIPKFPGKGLIVSSVRFYEPNNQKDNP